MRRMRRVSDDDDEEEEKDDKGIDTEDESMSSEVNPCDEKLIEEVMNDRNSHWEE